MMVGCVREKKLMGDVYSQTESDDGCEIVNGIDKEKRVREKYSGSVYCPLIAITSS